MSRKLFILLILAIGLSCLGFYGEAFSASRDTRHPGGASATRHVADRGSTKATAASTETREGRHESGSGGGSSSSGAGAGAGSGSDGDAHTSEVRRILNWRIGEDPRKLLTSVRVVSHDSLWDKSDVVVHGIDAWHERKSEELRRLIAPLSIAHKRHTYALASVSLVYEKDDGSILITEPYDLPVVFSSSKSSNRYNGFEGKPTYCIDTKIDGKVAFKIIYDTYIKFNGYEMEPAFSAIFNRATGYIYSLMTNDPHDHLYSLFAHAEQSVLIYTKLHGEEIKEIVYERVPEEFRENIVASRIDIVVTKDMCPGCTLTLDLASRNLFLEKVSFIGVTGLHEHYPAGKDRHGSRDVDSITLRQNPDHELYLAIKMG